MFCEITSQERFCELGRKRMQSVKGFGKAFLKDRGFVNNMLDMLMKFQSEAMQPVAAAIQRSEELQSEDFEQVNASQLMTELKARLAACSDEETDLPKYLECMQEVFGLFCQRELESLIGGVPDDPRLDSLRVAYEKFQKMLSARMPFFHLSFMGVEGSRALVDRRTGNQARNHFMRDLRIAHKLFLAACREAIAMDGLGPAVKRRIKTLLKGVE